MGNSHGHQHHHHLHHKKSKLGRQRRLSEPEDNDATKIQIDFLIPSTSLNVSPTGNTPRITINGMASESLEDERVDRTIFHQRANSLSVQDLTMHRAKTTAGEKRRQFLSSNANVAVRSLDESLMNVKMKPLSRAKSHSPLKQMRTYSFRSLSSEENFLDERSCRIIKESWLEVDHKARETGKSFGLFVFERFFAKIPEIKILFGLEESDNLTEVSSSHSAYRHANLFTSILQLCVRNVDDLEVQVAPTIFKYGERHFQKHITPYMTEENVRLMCTQVVCVVADFLGDDGASPKCIESWIEMMRYLAQKLLDGHEYAKLVHEKKLSINKNDHHLFLML